MSIKAKLWIIIALLVLAFAVYWYEDEIKGYPPPWVEQQQQQKSENGVGLANPASVNCVDTLHGTLEIRDEVNGQVGYCHLPNGQVCEEWALFRAGSCMPPSH